MTRLIGLAGISVVLCLSSACTDDSIKPSGEVVAKAEEQAVKVIDEKVTQLGKQAYGACGACHLSAGEGVPGAFPPIAGRVNQFAATDDGRRYLVNVIQAGLLGSIEVDGVPYIGVMPGFASSLDDKAVSAVLNYVGQVLGKDSDVSFKPFTAKEVAAYKSESTAATNGHETYSIRVDLLKKHTNL